MDIQNELLLAINQAVGPSAIVVCLAAVGLNVHFGYTGLLNFGQAGFMAVAGYGLASMVTTWDQNFWVGIIVGIVLCVLLALPAGCSHAAIARRLSRHRDDRRCGDHQIRHRLVQPAREVRRPGRSAAVHPAPSRTSTRSTGRSTFLGLIVEPQRLLGDDRRLGTRRSCSA